MESALKLLVYSAVFGRYDSVKKPVFPETDVIYHLFTDVDIPADSGWDQVTVISPTDNPRRDARSIKVGMPVTKQAEMFDATLWLDGSMTPKFPVREIVERWLKDHDFAAFKHPERQCVYDETRHIVKLGKDQGGRMARARQMLRQEDFPKDYGLAATGVLARRQCEVVKEHAKLWLAAMDEVSLRDQVTFGWIAHKVTGEKSFSDWCGQIPGNVFSNKYFSRAEHKP